MKERAITAKILEWLKAQPGVFAVKIHGGPYQRAGLPDVHATVAGRSVWLEVKRPGEVATPLQEATIARLFAAGAVVAVVTSLEEAARLVKPLLIGSKDSERPDVTPGRFPGKGSPAVDARGARNNRRGAA